MVDIVIGIAVLVIAAAAFLWIQRNWLTMAKAADESARAARAWSDVALLQDRRDDAAMWMEFEREHLERAARCRRWAWPWKDKGALAEKENGSCQGET